MVVSTSGCTMTFQVKLIVLKGGVVSSGQLLNVTVEMERKFSADAAQTFLRTLTKEHWLTEVWVNKLTLNSCT